MDPYEQRLGTILQTLIRLQADAGRRLAKHYGVSSHRFQMRKTASEAELQHFEAAHGIRLPDDYRAFLRICGNGGPGPHNGILPLSEWDHTAGWVADAALPADQLRQACPIVPEREYQPGWLAEVGGIEHAFRGAINIGSQGCTYETLLVVTGAARGRVLYVDVDEQPPWFPEDPTFLDWYERWLLALTADDVPIAWW
jgi:hypothetical protein